MEIINECTLKLEEINTTVCGIINDNEPKSLLLRQMFQKKFSDKMVHTPGNFNKATFD